MRPICLLHPSFRDLLVNEQRCHDESYWVEERKTHGALAHCCLQLMSNNLKRDVCGLHAPDARADEVPWDRIKQCLSAELQYACQYWVEHLKKSETPLLDNEQVHVFLQKHLLHWLEALSLIGKTSEGILAIISLVSITQVSNSSNSFRRKSY